MRTDSSEKKKAILRNVLFFLRSWNPRSRISPPGIRSSRSENGILSRLGGIIENWDDQIPAVEAPRVLRAFFFHENVPRHLHIFPNVRPNTFQRAAKNREGGDTLHRRRDEKGEFLWFALGLREKKSHSGWKKRERRYTLSPIGIGPRRRIARQSTLHCAPVKARGPRFAPSDSNRNEIIVGVEP